MRRLTFAIAVWHVVHSLPQAEAQVSKYLTLLGMEAYAPRFPPPPGTRPGSVRDRRHRWVFPRYVFLRTPPGFRDWDRIRWSPGVSRLLDADGRPAGVADDVVEHLRRRLAERELTPRRRWQRGQMVSITRGPLRMVEAIFDHELDAPSRVRILVTLLGRPVPVEVDPAVLVASG